MAEINLTQTEADALIAMPKIRTNEDIWEYPVTGGSICIPLESEDKKENFLLDVSRGQINFAKGKYQNRARQIIILARLDFGGSSHRNPDDKEITGTHLHLYREGFGDKWAFEVPVEGFSNVNDPWAALRDFMRYCNISEPPYIERGLFI